MKNSLYIIIFFYFIFGVACSDRQPFEIKDFIPVTNYGNPNDLTKIIYLDYTDAIDSGFFIPSVRQVDNGKFRCSFKIKNTSGQDRAFYYKIFYRNETYKFNENIESELPYTDENFYGSWENTGIEFKSTGIIPDDDNFHEITDLIRIAGNPRNEEKYYFPRSIDSPIPNYLINKKIEEIKNNKEWYDLIIQKASENNIDINKQLYLDAVYVIKEYYKNNPANQRWMRNPRVGNYSFCLVVVTKEQLYTLPDYFKNINKKFENKYVDPYAFIAKRGNLNVLKVDNAIKVIAKPELDMGIFIPEKIKFKDTSNYNCKCNNYWNMYNEARFAQFFHHIDSSLFMSNIPVVMDVYSDEFSKEKYEEFKNTFDESSRLKNLIEITNSPCKTVYYDSSLNAIVLINPASTKSRMRKENTGIITRHAFTYGKYTAKVKLPELLNKNNIWNGLTNALWLIYQVYDVNTRRICKNGYIPKHFPLADKQRSNIDPYSEIDIEIVKTSQNWPDGSYKKSPELKILSPDKEDDIIITCTNWDLACPDPPKFNIGAYKIEYEDTFFIGHRWDHWYQASTIKTPANDDEVFGSDYYYFQIEWRPKEIIWRAGPSKDKMKVIGYTNDQYTVIPNNQMLFTITQEYHLSWWWPKSQFSQDFIPFPAKDIKGYFYELTIE
ncbi:MAG: hypothetical protein Kow0068_03610 [Marinilabiliales bacterium]